jgi:hypothetical protein
MHGHTNIKFSGVTLLQTLSEPARVSTNTPESAGAGQHPTFKVVLLEANMFFVTVLSRKKHNLQNK